MALTTRRARHAAVIAALAAAFVVASGRTTEGVTRLMRRYGGADGLSAPVHALAQDAHGFVWLGSQGGITRFDGREFRRWARDVVSDSVTYLAASPDGRVFGVTETGALFEITDRGARIVEESPGVALSNVQHLDFGGDATLWVIASGTLRARRPDGTWIRIPTSSHGDESLRFVEAADAFIYATSSSGLWRIAAREPWQARRFPVADVVDGLLATPDGTVWLGTFTGVRQLRGDRIVDVAGVTSRAGPFVLRNDTVWASTPFRLVGFRNGALAEDIGPSEGVSNAGPLLVDRDHGLWIGTFTGAIYVPEPATRTWNETDGLISSHGTRVAVPATDDAWFLTWQGLGRVTRQGTTYVVRNESAGGWGALCVDDLRRVWTPGRRPGTYAVRTPGIIEQTAPAPTEHVSSCAPAAGGGMWFGQASGVFRVTSPGAPAQWLAGPPWPSGGAPYVDRVSEDRHGRVWVNRGADICWTLPLTTAPVTWTCQTLPGARDIGAVFHTPGDAIWVATHSAGIWRFDGSTWAQLPGSLAMEAHTFSSFASSRDGTVWVVGGSQVTRVEERSGDPAGWREVERLGPWQGYDGIAAADLAEEEDGTIWLATSGGLVRIPASARRSVRPPPLIVATDLLVDGVRRDRSGGWSLQAGQAFEVRYAVTSFKDRRGLRIEARVDEASPWLTLTELDPALRLAALAPGSYRIDARASADGVTWSSTEPLDFIVLPPWYRRWWSLAILVALAAGAGAGVYRIRTAMAMRLQDQRVRIARDLHDELGAGLGSIGILAGMAGADGVAETERRRATADIADSAAELGSALSDIVWSLRHGPSTLKALAYFVTERAGRLMPGPSPVFVADLPSEWPDAELSMVLRRNVSMVVLEALRNAVRHARASRVTLRLAQTGPARWTFAVEDDGRGLSVAGEQTGRGFGLDSMRQRAREIGGVLTVSDGAAGGTRLELDFELGDHRPWWRRLTHSGDGT